MVDVADQHRPKEWRHPRWISEHVFDKVRLIDCTFAEFDQALNSAGIIGETPLETVPGVSMRC